MKEVLAALFIGGMCVVITLLPVIEAIWFWVLFWFTLGASALCGVLQYTHTMERTRKAMVALDYLSVSVLALYVLEAFGVYLWCIIPTVNFVTWWLTNTFTKLVQSEDASVAKAGY